MKKVYFYIILFLLVVPPLIFFTDLTRNPYYFQIVLVNSGTVLLWLLWLYIGFSAKRIALPRTSLDIPLWSFFAVATLSWVVMLFSSQSHPYLGYSVFSEGFKRWLFLLVNSLLVYYAAVVFVNDDNRSSMVHAVLWTGFISSFYGILQYFGMELIWPHVLNPFGGRSVSTFGNPNFLSSYLVMVFPLIFVLYIQAQTAFKRNFYLVCFLTFFAALLCTLTRSSWAGFFIAMVITIALVFIFERSLFISKKKLIFIPLILVIVLGIFWPKSRVSGYNPGVFQRLVESAEARDTNYAPWHQRRLIWSCAWHMVIERPVLGKGWGCFELFYPFYQGRHLFHEAYSTFRTHANNTHNEILEIWSQTGTVGLGIYLWFIITVLLYGLFLVRNLAGPKKLLAIALIASIVGMLTDNLLNVSLHFAIPAFLYWWHIGLLAGLGRSETISFSINSPVRRGLTVAFMALGACVIVRYSCNFMGEVHYFNGFKLSKQNNVQAAIPELESAHRLQRFEVNNNYELANCYARLGLRDKALYMYSESLRSNAGYDEIYFNLATVFVQQKNIDAAIEEYTRSLYINPVSAESYSAMGSIFLQNPGLYSKAGIALFNQCVHFFPRNKDIWNNLGYLYTKNDENENALAAYKKAFEIDPDFDLAKKNIRVTLSKLGKNDSVLDEAELLFKKTESNILGKNWVSAREQCERLVSIVPSSFKAHFYMGNIYFTTGQAGKAISEYKKALEIQPNSAALLANLGLVYYDTKQYDQAQETFRQLIQVDPQNQLAKEKLEQISRILYR